MTYQAIYNKQARQWDVEDETGQIVAMCRGEQEARRKAGNLTRYERAEIEKLAQEESFLGVVASLALTA